ncbi:histidine kinase [candidate division KSB1 bacterium]
MLKLLHILYILLFPILVNAQITFDLRTNEKVLLTQWQYHNGDNPEWINPDFDVSLSKTVNPAELKFEKEGIHFYRKSVFIAGQDSNLTPLMLEIGGVGYAFEVYWDGNRIGSSGVVSTDRSILKPGNYFLEVKLDGLQINTGKHDLVIRFVTNNFQSSYSTFFALLQNWEEWYSISRYLNHYYYFIFGVLLTIIILSVTLYLGIGKRVYFLIMLVIGILYLVFNYLNIKLTSEISILYYDYYYITHVVSYYLIELLLIGFFIFFLNIPKRVYHLILISIIFSVMLSLEFILSRHVENQGLVYIIYSSGILVYAFIKKKENSLLLLSGNTIFIASYILRQWSIEVSDKYLLIFDYSTNVLFLSCMILAICQRLISEEKNHERIRRKSQRLENEMLKLSIQPHFIMNTLLSIIHLISNKPGKAIKLIQLLADEFRLINKFSSMSMITVEEELQLCRIHLDLMGIRMRTQHEMSTENLDLSEKIPPMIFHTLIENGLTHALNPEESGVFSLSSQNQGSITKYLFRNGGSKLIEKGTNGNNRISEGLGILYVKARLEESFGNRWELNYGLKNNLWEVEINIEK